MSSKMKNLIVLAVGAFSVLLILLAGWLRGGKRRKLQIACGDWERLFHPCTGFGTFAVSLPALRTVSGKKICAGRVLSPLR